MFQICPGCVATGATIEEIEQQIKEAIAFALGWFARESVYPLPDQLLYVNM
jgi:predicted RNase H-like HicB family nuclease